MNSNILDRLVALGIADKITTKIELEEDISIDIGCILCDFKGSPVAEVIEINKRYNKNISPFIDGEILERHNGIIEEAIINITDISIMNNMQKDFYYNNKKINYILSSFEYHYGENGNSRGILRKIY